MKTKSSIWCLFAICVLLALSSCGGVSYDEDGYARVERKGKIGLYGPGKQMVLPCEYEEILLFNGDYAIVKRNGKYGIVNKTGRIVLQLSYFDLRDDNGVFVGKKGNGMYVIISNNHGRFTESSSQFKTICSFAGEETTAAQSLYGDGYGLIDRHGNEIMPFVFEEPFFLDSQGHAIVRQKGKYGIVDKNLKVIIPLSFDDSDIHFFDGVAVVKKDGKYGAIDEKANILAPFSFSSPNDVRESLKNRWVLGTWRISQDVGTVDYTFYANGICYAVYRFSLHIPNAHNNYKYNVENDKVTIIIPDDEDIVLMRLSDKRMVTYDHSRLDVKKIRNN